MDSKNAKNSVPRPVVEAFREDVKDEAAGGLNRRWFLILPNGKSTENMRNLFSMWAPLVINWFRNPIRRKFRPTIWTDEKQRWAEAERREE